ncbi:hypothetical protein B0H16DRAFT_1901798 [Mycena metata]|uniref:Uncharacterized protein n=1 Tax=Mycena metata TaxID=1033252 RepID=A0AAD7GUM3_9AGAR|nr:hypothetical protein B0H16DRAFT_1901798 [Mycena metata]
MSITASPTFFRVPMPIPRTPHAPYFDEREVRHFLHLILQNGSNAGIIDADELVTFIVRYSSDRVREIIRYIPELDDDTPNRTWSAAEQQMLLLYGSSDEERRSTERELIEYCRIQSAKSPYRTKIEVEQYLRGFQFIAAPLLKQREITTAQCDFYFVSGISSSIKNWFISQVPESQHTRSNPIPLADSVDILYSYFDPDALFPDACVLTTHTDFDLCAHHSAPATILFPTANLRKYQDTFPLSSASSHLEPEAIATPYIEEIDLHLEETIETRSVSPVEELFKASPDPSPVSSTPSPLELPAVRQRKHVHWDLGDVDEPHQDFTAEEQFKVPPSDDEPAEETRYQSTGSAIDSSEEYSITDRVSGLRWALDELKRLAAHPDVDQASVADIARGIQAELDQCSISTLCGYVGLQVSSHSSFNDDDSGGVSEMVADVVAPTIMDDDYECYLAGEYDYFELSSSDVLQSSDSGDLTESDSKSVFDFIASSEQQFNKIDFAFAEYPITPEPNVSTPQDDSSANSNAELSFNCEFDYTHPFSDSTAPSTSQEVNDELERYLSGEDPVYSDFQLSSSIVADRTS